MICQESIAREERAQRRRDTIAAAIFWTTVAAIAIASVVLLWRSNRAIEAREDLTPYQKHVLTRF